MGKKSVDSQMKDRIIGHHLAGLGPSEISRRLKFKETGTTSDKKRSGRPRKTIMIENFF